MMATWNSEYEKALKENNKEAEKTYKERSQKNTQMSNDYIKGVNAIVDTSTQNAVKKVNEEIDTIPTQYQLGYDTNAIQQKINERQVAERMANLGLTDSGLNRTQQTAINIQRSNADAALTQQKNAAITSLKKQIADIRASGELTKQQNQVEAAHSVAQTNNTLYNSLMDNAKANAVSYANNWQSSQKTNSNSVVSNYDNNNYDSDIVKQAQNFVGASADGKWGTKSSSAAKAKGYNSLAEVVQEIEGLADKAAEYYNEHPNVTLDSRTLDMWLHDNGISGTAATTFKAYLQQAGAKTSGRR